MAPFVVQATNPSNLPVIRVIGVPTTTEGAHTYLLASDGEEQENGEEHIQDLLAVQEIIASHRYGCLPIDMYPQVIDDDMLDE